MDEEYPTQPEAETAVSSDPRDLLDYLRMAVEHGGSDLHITAGAPPAARVYGSLVPLEEFNLEDDACQEMILSVLTDSQRARLEEDWELDFALHVQGIGRFRGNAHYNRGIIEGAFRHIPEEIPDLQTLGHWPVVESLCQLQEGLILITGMTGSGKSTTLASMVQRISQQRSGVIVSVEDPIEFVFQHDKSIVKQREVGADTHSFAQALRHVLRQDPDVILVSEMRDLETLRTAITAAETGHLVISTLHTIDAPKALDRIIDVFPADQQGQIIAQLSNALEAVISQRLLPRADGAGRILASEIMLMNHGIRAVLRQRKFEQILGLMEIAQADGMRTIDDSIEDLFKRELITYPDALSHCRDRARLEKLKDELLAADKKGKGMFGRNK